MQYASVICQPAALAALVNSSKSAFAPELSSILEQVVCYITENEVYDLEYVDFVLSLELAERESFDSRIDNFINAVSELALAHEGNLITGDTSRVLEDHYIPCFNVAIMAAIHCIDGLSSETANVSAQQLCSFRLAIKLASMLRSFDTHTDLLLRGEAIYESQRQGAKKSAEIRSKPTSIDLLILELASVVWSREPKVSVKWLAELIFDQLSSVFDAYQHFGCEQYVRLALFQRLRADTDRNGRRFAKQGVEDTNNEDFVLVPLNVPTIDAIRKRISKLKPKCSSTRPNAELKHKLDTLIRNQVGCSSKFCPCTKTH